MGLNYIFTVITSTYNCGPEFEKTAQSIDGHENNIQWIVIDSCSNEKTINLINSQSHLIDVFISEKDDGIYDAWNKALKHVKSKWVIFLGAGDYLNTSSINKLFNILNKSNNEQIVFGNLLLTDSSGVVIKKITGGKIFKKKYKNGTIYKPINPETFISTSLFENEKFDTRFKIVGDADFLIRMILRDIPFKYIDVDVSVMSSGGVSSRPDKINSLLEEISLLNTINNIHVPFIHMMQFRLKLIVKWLVYILLNNKYEKIRTIIKK